MNEEAGGTRGAVAEALARHRDRPGALLPVLHHIQDALGYIPEECVAQIAAGLDLSRADVHGTIGFYHHFRRTPPARHLVRVCRAEACQSMGAERLLAHAQSTLGAPLHGTSADGMFALEPVYCLGNCACSPAIMVDDALYGRVDPQRLDALAARCRESR